MAVAADNDNAVLDGQTEPAGMLDIVSGRDWMIGACRRDKLAAQCRLKPDAAAHQCAVVYGMLASHGARADGLKLGYEIRIRELISGMIDHQPLNILGPIKRAARNMKAQFVRA